MMSKVRHDTKTCALHQKVCHKVETYVKKYHDIKKYVIKLKKNFMTYRSKSRRQKVRHYVKNVYHDVMKKYVKISKSMVIH